MADQIIYDQNGNLNCILRTYADGSSISFSQASPLSRCERYYWKLGTQDGFSPFFDYHPAYSTTAVMGRVHFPVVMRIPPAMATGGSLRIEDGVTVFTAGLVATDYGNGQTNEGHNINVAVTGPITQFRTYRFSANNDTTAYVAFDADF